MKFLHAADVHLDSPLRGLERYDGAPVEELRGATREALKNLVELAIAEQVAFVLIAGDIYDGDWKDYNTGLFFSQQMARLNAASIPVYLIRGNHDAASQISKQLRLPANVFEFPHDRPKTVTLDEHGVAIHGQGFASQSVTEDLSAHYPPAKSGYLNIGLLHTSAGGRPGHENYAPCTPEGLSDKGYDYWALGHVHQREILKRDPWIVFPGNIQGRHIREVGSKGCSLVSVENGRVTAVDHCELDVLRWTECVVDLKGATDPGGALDAVRTALERAQSDAGDRLLAVRLRLIGESPSHSALVASREQFTNDCRALATDVGAGQVWIEKIRLETTPVEEAADLDGRTDAIGELLKFIHEGAHSPEFLQELKQDITDLVNKLPPELKSDPDPFDLDDLVMLARFVPGAAQTLQPRLRAQKGK